MSAPLVTHVQICDDERASGTMTRENIEKAVVALAQDGVVILNDSVSKQSLDFLNARIAKEAQRLRESSNTQFNYDKEAQNVL